MKPAYTIPKNAPENILIDLHREILITNPRVRCHFKWGNFTEYSVKLNQKNVEHIAGCEVATTAPFRLTIGVDCEFRDDPITAALEVWDGEQHEWVAALDMMTNNFGDVVEIDESGFLQRLNKFVLDKHPAIAALIEIDVQMFRLRGVL
jgi:hypothetical protein